MTARSTPQASSTDGQLLTPDITRSPEEPFSHTGNASSIAPHVDTINAELRTSEGDAALPPPATGNGIGTSPQKIFCLKD